MSIKTNKNKRVYRKITKQTVAKFKADMLASGNGTRAIEDNDPDYDAPHQRAYRIIKHGEYSTPAELIDNALQQIAGDAVQRLSDVVNSSDEGNALRATMYTIDHLRGKAVQRNESKVVSISIESVL